MATRGAAPGVTTLTVGGTGTLVNVVNGVVPGEPALVGEEVSISVTLSAMLEATVLASEDVLVSGVLVSRVLVSGVLVSSALVSVDNEDTGSVEATVLISVVVMRSVGIMKLVALGATWEVVCWSGKVEAASGELNGGVKVELPGGVTPSVLQVPRNCWNSAST